MSELFIKLKSLCFKGHLRKWKVRLEETVCLIRYLYPEYIEKANNRSAIKSQIIKLKRIKRKSI
jgi:hypothetical protein